MVMFSAHTHARGRFAERYSSAGKIKSCFPAGERLLSSPEIRNNRCKKPCRYRHVDWERGELALALSVFAGVKTCYYNSVIRCVR